MSIDTNVQIKLNALANQLLEQDEDKVITKQELQDFVKSNEAEFVSLNMDTSKVENELSEILKDNMQKTENENNADDTNTNNNNNNDDAEIKELKDKIKNLKDKVKGYDLKLTNLNTTLDTLNNQLDIEQSKYEKLEQEAKAQNKKLEAVISSIDNATKKMEDDAQYKQKTASLNAIAEYNPEVDGEWDEYIREYMGDVEVDSSLKSNLSNLVSKSDFLQTNLGSLAKSLTSQASKIENLNVQITATQADITSTTKLKDEANAELKTLNTELSAKIAAQSASSTGSVDYNQKTKTDDVQESDSNLSKDDVMNLIPCEEKALIAEKNLDLTEKLSDGSPRYIFAKGGSDNKYHVYDMLHKHRQGYYFSIARLYGHGGGREGLKGEDYCESGSGYISTLGDGCVPDGERGVKDEDGNYGIFSNSCDVYFLDDCETVKQYECCSYSTASPLAFDLNGDGVKTSDKVIDYDIDGDGELDKINDSADAVLVFDKDGDGISGKDGSEAFGNNTDLDGDGKADGYKDGFEALKALAKKEGLINGSDDNKLDEKDLELLEEKYGLGIKKDGYLGETSSFKDAGITEINLADTDETTLEDNFDGNGNQLMRQEGATFKINGETREYADIWHKKLSENDIELLPKGSKSSGSNFFRSSSLALNISEINKNIRSAKNIKQEADKAFKSAEEIKNFFVDKPENIDEVQETNEEDIKKEELEKELKEENEK